MNATRGSGVRAFAMMLLVVTSTREAHGDVWINELLGGCGDSPEAQFVEIGLSFAPADWASCVQLEFYDAHGGLEARLPLAGNPPAVASGAVLVATADLARLPDVPPPDFTMPPLVATPAGEVCVRDTGRPGCPAVTSCLAYGAGIGRPVRAPSLPADGSASLQVSTPRFGEISLAVPTPQNTAGRSARLRCVEAARIARGERLFFEETFGGNGRTCGTCHPAASAFTIGPSAVTALPPDDPLFAAERQSALAELERPLLLRGPRTLILENVDGFDRPPVFRGIPHLLNVGRTAPYGLSGDVPDLRTFSAIAVRQHFPKTLARVPGVDFRQPTEDELVALEAFMQTIFAGDPEGLNPWLLQLDGAAARGRETFFEARCANCHGGPFLGATGSFDTGVTRRPINLVPPAECPECPPIGPLERGRAFDVPSLLGVRGTAPFFHDNSAATLRDAVAFYASPSFNESPGAQFSGRIALTEQQIDDVTAFLEALTGCGNGRLDSGEACDDGNARDGDCCSATCEVAVADGVVCDDRDACTMTTACRSGTCSVVEPEACGTRACTDSDTLSSGLITCALMALPRDARRCMKRDARIRRKLDLGARLAEHALGDGSSRRAAKTLARAAGAFGSARRLAFRVGGRRCQTIIGVATDAQERALCVRECVR